jgi:peptidoglycan-N-acetylglucosamine deacetylase
MFYHLTYWIVGIISIVLILFFQPRSLLSLAELIIPGVVYFVKTDAPVIALTIDDGPDPQTTQKILDVLAQHQVSATFFLISSRVIGQEQLVAEMVDRGHEIGNHLTQDKPSIKLSPSDFAADLSAADIVLSQFMQPKWLRPAGGWYKASMIKTAHQFGYRVALGNIFPYDTSIASSWFASQHILWNVSPGAIVVLHDSGAWGERTVQILSRILPVLRQRGYQVVSLSKLSAMT